MDREKHQQNPAVLIHLSRKNGNAVFFRASLGKQVLPLALDGHVGNLCLAAAGEAADHAASHEGYRRTD